MSLSTFYNKYLRGKFLHILKFIILYKLYEIFLCSEF